MRLANAERLEVGAGRERREIFDAGLVQLEARERLEPIERRDVRET